MTYRRVVFLMGLTVALQGALAMAYESHGVRPVNAWNCPASHPIKGNYTTRRSAPCVYHVPASWFYERARPERCYESERQAQEDDCRRSEL
jgi:hypothetical protein